MCGGGSEPEEQQPTAADIAELNSASTKHAQYMNTFAPLESQAIAESTGANREREQDFFRGRATADLALAEAKSNPPGTMATAINQGQGSLTLRSAADNVATAHSSALGEADQLAQKRFADKKLSIVQTGRGMSRLADSGLRTAQQNQQSTAINDMANKASARNSKMAAVNTMLNSGLKAGMIHRGNVRHKERMDEMDTTRMTNQAMKFNPTDWETMG